MKKNIGNTERVLRFVGGIALTSLAFWGPKQKRYFAFLIPAITGMVGICPLYSALQISTRRESQDASNDYFPVQSASERVAGHPIVGVS